MTEFGENNEVPVASALAVEEGAKDPRAWRSLSPCETALPTLLAKEMVPLDTLEHVLMELADPAEWLRPRLRVVEVMVVVV